MKMLKCWFASAACLSMVGFANTSVEMTPGKAAVIGQIRSLMADEKSDAKSISTEKPYLHIIKGSNGRATLIYRCRHTKSKNLIDSIEGIVTKSGIVEESKDENMLIISDIEQKIDEIRSIILALDVTVPQVLVEAKVIEVYTQNQDQRELEWDINKGLKGKDGIFDSTVQEGTSAFPASGRNPDVFNFTPFSAGISGSFNRLHFFLKWLNTVNDAKILSSPNLTVSLNSTGSIVTGEDLPIQSTSTTGSTVNTDIKYKRTGIELEVTPLRINSDSVKLQVTPQVSTVTRYESFNDTRTPVVSIRNVKTELTVRDGEVIMLGGLYSSEEIRVDKKIPILGDIPGLKWLFTSTDHSTALKQLIFLLKVSIISAGNDTFVDIEEQARDLRKAGRLLNASNDLFPKKEEKVDSEKTEISEDSK